MRLSHHLLVITIVPSIALGFVVPHRRVLNSRNGLAAESNDFEFEAPTPPDEDAPSSSLSTRPKQTRREMRIEQLQQEIQASLEKREELRLELEQDIRAFQQEYETERSNLESVDADIKKQIQQLERVKTGGGGLQEVLSSLDAPVLPLAAALSGAAVVATREVVKRRERFLQEERQRLEEEREILRIMKEMEAEKKLVQSRRSVIASVAATGVIGAGLFATGFMNSNTPADVVDEKDSLPVAVENVESKPTPPEAVPSIVQTDTPPTISKEENVPFEPSSSNLEEEPTESPGVTESIQVPGASEVTGAVSKALENYVPDASDITDAVTKSLEENLQVADTTKLGGAISDALQDLPRPALAAAGATLTAALVAGVLGLSKGDESTASTVSQLPKTTPDTKPRKTEPSVAKNDASTQGGKPTTTTLKIDAPTSDTKHVAAHTDTSVSVESKPPSKLERRDMDSKTHMAKSSSPSIAEKQQVEPVVSKTSNSAPPKVATQKPVAPHSIAEPKKEKADSQMFSASEPVVQTEEKKISSEHATTKPAIKQEAKPTIPTRSPSQPDMSKSAIPKPNESKPVAKESDKWEVYDKWEVTKRKAEEKANESKPVAKESGKWEVYDKWEVTKRKAEEKARVAAEIEARKIKEADRRAKEQASIAAEAEKRRIREAKVKANRESYVQQKALLSARFEMEKKHALRVFEANRKAEEEALLAAQAEASRILQAQVKAKRESYVKQRALLASRLEMEKLQALSAIEANRKAEKEALLLAEAEARRIVQARGSYVKQRALLASRLEMEKLQATRIGEAPKPVTKPVETKSSSPASPGTTSVVRTKNDEEMKSMTKSSAPSVSNTHQQTKAVVPTPATTQSNVSKSTNPKPAASKPVGRPAAIATTESSKRPPLNPATQSERKEVKSDTARIKPVASSPTAGVSQTKSKPDSTKSATIKATKVSEAPKTGSKAAMPPTMPSTSTAAPDKHLASSKGFVQDEILDKEKASKANAAVRAIDEMMHSMESNTGTKPKAKMSAPNKHSDTAMPPARGFGKDSPVKSKSKSSKSSKK